jgi:hypothetical protein
MKYVKKPANLLIMRKPPFHKSCDALLRSRAGQCADGYKMDNNGIYASGGAAGKDASPSSYTLGRYDMTPGDNRMRGELTHSLRR